MRRSSFIIFSSCYREWDLNLRPFRTYRSPINPPNSQLIMPVAVAGLIASQESPIMGAKYISGIVIQSG